MIGNLPTWQFSLVEVETKVALSTLTPNKANFSQLTFYPKHHSNKPIVCIRVTNMSSSYLQNKRVSSAKCKLKGGLCLCPPSSLQTNYCHTYTLLTKALSNSLRRCLGAWHEMRWNPTQCLGGPSSYLSNLLYPFTLTWKQWFNISSTLMLPSTHLSHFPRTFLPHISSLSTLWNPTAPSPQTIKSLFFFLSFLHLNFHLWSSMQMFFHWFVFRFLDLSQLFSSKICWFSKESAITSTPKTKVLIAWWVWA